MAGAALCQAPQERLFLHGRWQEGLEPRTGPTARDRDQLSRFEARIDALRAAGEFTIPMAPRGEAGSAARSDVDGRVAVA